MTYGVEYGDRPYWLDDSPDFANFEFNEDDYYTDSGIMPWGKYAGKRLYDVVEDRRYCEFLLTLPWFEEWEQLREDMLSEMDAAKERLARKLAEAIAQKKAEENKWRAQQARLAKTAVPIHKLEIAEDF